jgi:hypothetical protein
MDFTKMLAELVGRFDNEVAIATMGDAKTLLEDEFFAYYLKRWHDRKRHATDARTKLLVAMAESSDPEGWIRSRLDYESMADDSDEMEKVLHTFLMDRIAY